jgi:heat shock protein HslJ
MLRKLTLALLLLSVAQQASAEARLTGGDWIITQLGAEALGDAPELTLAFDAEGRVSGHSGCNRFMGGAKQDGQMLEFTALASTMMACAPTQMELERRMLDHLGQTRSFAITPGGALELMGEEGLVLRATR